jgi:hypothetical protein
MKVLKVIGAVIAFFFAHRNAIEGFVRDAEVAFPEAGSGLKKLEYVLGRIFTYADTVESGLSKLDPEDVTPLLAGHVSQVVAEVLPKPIAS